MSQALTQTRNAERRGGLFSHPLFVNIFTPIALAIIFGALTVYVTQTNTLFRVATFEHQMGEVKSQIVPREEQKARLDAIEKRLEAIEKNSGTMTQRVDDIYKLLTQPRR
jgi:hypothetical protein